MAKKYLVNIDLGGNQILYPILSYARVQNSASNNSPSVVGAGQLWYDSTNNQLNVYNGSAFTPLTTGGTAVTSLNSFTGGVNIYGTASQVSVTNSTGSITLSLPSTVSMTTACATNFYGAFNGTATNASQLGNTAASAYALLSSANFTAASVGGNAVATQSYVTTASVAYATNAGTSASTTQTAFSSLTTTGDISIGGNLYISGSTTTISGSTVTIADPLLYIATSNPANLNDIGIVGHFTSASVYQHTGLVRDHADGTWKLFSGVAGEPSNTIDFSSATYDPLKTGGLQINSSSTTTTASITSSGSATFAAIIKSGGTSSQFLKADGSVDSSTYLTSSGSIASASNSASLGGTAASAYALLSSANFTAASVSSNRILTTNDKLSAHAATTSSELAGVISDETGSGSLVFSAGPTFTGTVSGSALTLTGALTASTGTTTLGTTTTGSVTATALIKSGGTSSQFLKADGSVDSSVYLTSSGSIASASNSASLGGVAAASYALLASPSFTGTISGSALTLTGALTASTGTTTLGTTNVGAFTATSASIGSIAVARKFVGTVTGDNATASFSFTHNMGTRDVSVQVYQTSATPDTQYAEVEADIERTTASAVKVTFATAPAGTTTYNVVIVG